MGAVSSLIINTLSQFSLTLKLTRGLFENWRLPPFYKPDLTHTVCTLIQQAPPTHSPLCLARAASHHPVDRTLTLLYDCLYLFLCCCFTDKSFRLKPLVFPLVWQRINSRLSSPLVLPRINSWLPSLSSCVTSDKLAVPLSSPVVTLDKLKLTHQLFCPLLYSTSTRYKTIILELVRNSSGH